MQSTLIKEKQTIQSVSASIPGRREFLKQSGLALGLASLFTCPGMQLLAKKDNTGNILAEEGKWVSTTCQGCTTWCAVQVYVQGGRAVKVRGNPISKANEGYVCPKGHMIVKQLYDPDRLKVPMKRTNSQKGKFVNPGFVPITWDEALDTIANRLIELRNNEEIHKFMLLRGRYSPLLNSLMYSAMPGIIGTPNNISHSAICAEAEKFGPYYTEGLWDYRDYDLINTKYLVLWGTDPLSSNRQIPNMINKFWQITDRGKVLVIDPRLSVSAAKANEWLPIKPGYDGAFAVALAHTILSEGLWSKEFVGDFNDGVNRFTAGTEVSEDTFTETHTNGVVKWWNIELKDKTPQWCESVTGISQNIVTRLAREMAAAAPKVAIWLGPGAVMTPRGAYTSMAIHTLNGLLGSIDNEGGVVSKVSTKTGSMTAIDNYLDDIAKTGRANKKIDHRGDLDMPSMASGRSGGGVVTNKVADAILESDPYDIKMIIGYWCNFNYSCTGTDRWDRAMAKVPFFVHVTPNASEMTQFADIVLPTTFSAAEKLAGSSNFANLYSTISIQQPVIDRFFDVKDDETEIMWLLAKKLKDKGFPNLFDYYQNEFKNPETSEIPSNEKDFALNAIMIATKPSYDQVGGWDKFKEQGLLNYGPKTFKTKWDNFGTKTKKFEFYSITLKDTLQSHADKHKVTIDEAISKANYTATGELAFVPHWEEPFRIGSKSEYPFDFVDYKSKLNREGRSQNLTWYQEFRKLDPGDAKWDDYIKINPKDAEKLNFTDGQEIEMVTTDGKFKTKVHLWEGVMPGTVLKAFGQGHWAYGKVASLSYNNFTPRGLNNNDFMPMETERLSGSNCRSGGYFGIKLQPVTSVFDGNEPKPAVLSSIYPNPARDNINLPVYMNYSGKIEIEILDMHGRAVYRSAIDLAEGSHIIPIATSALTNGAYILRLTMGHYSTSEKFIINK